MKRIWWLLPLLLVVVLLNFRPNATSASESEDQLRADAVADFIADQQTPYKSTRLSATSCVNGTAGTYPCNNIDLLSHLPLSEIGGGSGNDIWGWVDPQNGDSYALMGRSNGTAFVDISDPENPVYLGNLPTHTSNSSWRDIKVYDNHAFIVSEASGHGVQIFDLTQLRSVASPPATFSNTAHYDGIGSCHNIVINEDSGFAYGVGCAAGTQSRCAGGLHIINIQTPASPTFAGCFSNDGYTHDAQCVNYSGPDTDYSGAEICFNSNADTLTIADVSDKTDTTQISRTGYAGRGYTHQGWLTEDQQYFFLNDETDELNQGINTTTLIWNVRDLDNPILLDKFVSTETAIDHNLYVKDGYVYQANYRAGLRILDASDVASGNLSEIAYFDIYPDNNNAAFNGAWSNYPYFENDVIVVSGIEQGLFVLQLNLTPTAVETRAVTLETGRLPATAWLTSAVSIVITLFAIHKVRPKVANE